MSSTKRILYIVQRFPAPSETFILEEVLGVQKLGYFVNVLSLLRPSQADLDKVGSAGAKINEFVRFADWSASCLLGTLKLIGSSFEIIRAMRLMGVRGFRRKCGLLFKLLKVMNAVAQFRPDCIVSHWPRPTELACLVSLISGIPFFVSVHAHEVAHDNGHFRFALDKATAAFFCNSDAMKRLLKCMPSGFANKSFLVHHGVDVDKFLVAPLPDLVSGLKLVAIGRLTATKGFDRLVEFVSEARRQSLDVRLDILGDGPQRAHLEGMINSAGLAHVVKLHGWVHHSVVAKMLADCHVLCCLADLSDHEGLPNVVLEAMAIGRPVVASPLPALNDVFVHGDVGIILSSPHDRSGFVEACRSYLHKRDLLNSHSDCGVLVSRHWFSRELLCRHLCSLIDAHLSM